MTRGSRPAAVLAAILALATPSARAAALAPNVILVLADDLGPGEVNCYGGQTAPTPNLDRMAKEGIRFTRYYSASPICSASRCGLLTGQFPARWQITSYLQTRAGNRACEQADFLDPKAPALPRALKAAGYATAHVGKWHLGGGRDVVDPPKFAAYGYDQGLGTWESPEPHPEITARDWIWSAADPVKRWDRTRWMVDRTLDFLDAHPERPCFVNLWLDDTHTPWVPSADDQKLGKNGRASGRGDTPDRLRRVVIEMDRQIGRLLDLIRAKPSARPTIVLFLADNGPLPTFEGARTVGLRGSKLSLYEGGVRLPLIAWGPGIVAEGSTDESSVIGAVDLFPTLCRICGADLPADYRSDGEDRSVALLGRPSPRKRSLFWEYGRNDRSFAYPGGADRSPNLAVLDGDWKLLVNADGSQTALYQVGRDPKETQDLAHKEPVVSRRLREAVLAWRRSLP